MNKIGKTNYNQRNKIFVICPVRLATEKVKTELEEYVAELEKQGYQVHLPHRDTAQDDETGGFNICNDNMEAISYADEVHIFYDGRSQGIHFDIGIAFAKHKRIKLITINEDTPEAYLKESKKNKEFPLMLKYWADAEKRHKEHMGITTGCISAENNCIG